MLCVAVVVLRFLRAVVVVLVLAAAAAAAAAALVVAVVRGYDGCINCYKNNQKGLFVVVLLLFQGLFVVVPFLILW